ncbi:LysR family transcriptional regulator [Halobacteriovorax sp. HLS]|uniref:LysR family transcriptional regulator n=1 Tax=Halobacteriovorax sp. HLS TaxID=2234000 RepID=UPI000FD86BF6|nr:LysR family transcriptional regulator [Halobacteriovorax sp. HLS]
MFIDTINLNLLRIFESVYRNKSMTKAAFELNMTQSGVSQNVKNLELMLGVSLFDRVKKRPIATDKAHQLYESCHDHLYGLNDALARTMGKEQDFAGQLTIALPSEYGNNIILPILKDFSNKYEKVNYKIHYGHAASINKMLLTGELDFAIVDSYGLDKEIKTVALSSEELVLCCSREYMNQNKGSSRIDRGFFESLKFISYMDDSPLVRSWFSHHYQFQNMQINSCATLLNAQGVAQLITLGMGVGILPIHIVDKLKESGQELHVFRAKTTALLNSLSMAYLESKTMSKAMHECIEFITKALKS